MPHYFAIFTFELSALTISIIPIQAYWNIACSLLSKMYIYVTKNYFLLIFKSLFALNCR